MTMNITIQNANTMLLNAIKSVVRLSPDASIKVTKAVSLEDELLAERNEILEKLNKGTVKTFSSMSEYRKSREI